MSEPERQELQKILDDNGSQTPVENFPGMQPFGKPKYNNKSHKQGGADRQGFNSSFISGAGLEETSSTPNKQNVFTGVGIS